MTNKERYKQAFRVLHASDNISLEAKMNMDKKKVFKSTHKLVATCVCAAMILGLSVTAYAYGEQIISRIFGWGNNLEITKEIDENGDVISKSVLNMDNLTEPVVIQDGKMTFIVNGESIDITGQISETKAFQYEYVDEDGNTHIWLVGLNSDDISDYGYAEFIKDPEGMWAGGCSVRVNPEIDGGSSSIWLENAKKELNIPW